MEQCERYGKESVEGPVVAPGEELVVVSGEFSGSFVEMTWGHSVIAC